MGLCCEVSCASGQVVWRSVMAPSSQVESSLLHVQSCLVGARRDQSCHVAFPARQEASCSVGPCRGKCCPVELRHVSSRRRNARAPKSDGRPEQAASPVRPVVSRSVKSCAVLPCRVEFPAGRVLVQFCRVPSRVEFPAGSVTSSVV